ncbi:purine permease [Sansalvadorimonas sp. 2012CJ34-2]|uniref:Purine permease n=1 Tax=Parendozoicomonas callyspongiae TaxID=2942213 RepID=A0ABT0PGV7_9GAMM|nr:nucleobase:cation symporter-2 family protein [Sansalvadorimonas sp. 2012CJ34-2]MCL6270612.1 purine permease [Sansalvadorimonas sp. 2012CJ34-2]
MENSTELHIGKAQVTENQFATDLVYELEENPPFIQALFAAVQHVLSIFLSIIAPPLIICGALNVDITTTSYIVSMSLFISGVATFIQAKRFGPVGSGLLSIQGTSFSFLGPIIGAGVAAIEGGSTPEQALAIIFGVCLAGSFIEMAISRFFHIARKVFTPLVTGTVVTLIGMTLIKVGITSMGGGYAAMGNGTFGSFQNLSIAFLTLATIIIFNNSKNTYLRMSSIFIGIIVGYVVSIFLGIVDFSELSKLDAVAIPQPFKFGIDFTWAAFLPIAFVYLVTAVESIGDLTATSAVSKQPVKGPAYIKRIKGGVLGDGVNSFIASVFNTFPNTTFSQNNGVIQLTGVASRYVGYYVAVILVMIGMFPIVGGVFKLLPQAVLGGATIIMFGTIATSGIRIIASEKLDKRGILILATSFGMGLGVSYVPDVLNAMPEIVKSILSSGYTTGGLTAMILNLIIPNKTYEMDELSGGDHQQEAA